MNWHEKVRKAAVKNRHALYEEDDDGHEFWGFSSESDAQDHGFEEGAKWQREQLRTDEAVDELVRSLYRFTDDEWCDPAFEEERNHWRGKVRAAIDALLGEEE